MKNIAKFVFLAAGFGLLAALLATGPFKTAAAGGSTSVPAPLPVVAAISGTPFEAALCHAFGPTEGNLCGTQGSSFVVPTTTTTGLAVKRLVVENVSGVCAGENTPLIAAILFSPFVADSQPNTATAMAHYLSLTLQTTGPGPNSGQTERDYSFSGTTRMFFNPGDTVSERIEFFTPSDGDALCNVQVEGTLVTPSGQNLQ